jgi:hypothetical protein
MLRDGRGCSSMPASAAIGRAIPTGRERTVLAVVAEVHAVRHVGAVPAAAVELWSAVSGQATVSPLCIDEENDPRLKSGAFG